MNLVAKFDVLQRVVIKEIGQPARVTAVKFDGSVRYELEYWWNSEMKVVWQYEDEIREACPKP